MNKKLLVIEDEAKYAYILEKFFKKEGFDVVLAFDGISGVEMFKKENPDIIILDIMLPKMSGYEVAERIRKESDTPIIMTSALSEESDILKGYDLHIDDYVTKPFRTSILIAKVKNTLERREKLKEAVIRSSEEYEKDDEINIGNIKLIKSNMQCIVNGEDIKITKTEFKLLTYFAENAGKNCTREQLFKEIWNDKDVDGRIIDAYVKKLRKMVEDGNCEIVTVFGIGYRFEEGK